MKFFRRLRSLFRKGKLDTEMAEEMRVHLEMQTERNVAAGMSVGEARYAAHRQFGGLDQIKETAREQRSWVWLEQLLQDVRFAARGLRKNPGFTTVAALTLAFGIGVNTSMFTALQAVLLREFALPDAGRVVEIFRTSPHSQRWPHSPANFLEQQAGNDVFESMAAVSPKPFNLAEPGRPAERVNGVEVSAEIFSVLGIRPLRGRAFGTDEDRPGANRVVLLDHGFWRRRFAGDPDVLNRELRLDGESVTVIGILPPVVSELPLFMNREVWRPIAFTDAQRRNRGGNYLNSLGRLKPSVSVEQAQTAMDRLAAQQARDHPETNSAIGLRIASLTNVKDAKGVLALWLTMGLAGFVLLIACANLANLQFARTARRTHELAIRGALGATRSRLLRQLLAESLLLALLGGALGLLLSQWGNMYLSRQISRTGELVLALNLKVLTFTFLASTVSGFAFGLVPAWLASRANVNEAMKQGSRGSTGDRSRNRLQHGLIVTEVALSLVLLAGAGLLVRGLQRYSVQHPGWQIDGLTIANFNLPDRKYPDARSRMAFVSRLNESLVALPGVTEVAFAAALPIRPFNSAGNSVIEDHAPLGRGHEPMRFINAVTPAYFSILNMRLLAGREFTEGDVAGRTPVVIINEAMARAFWPAESPLGKHVDGEEIVGVVSDVRFPAYPDSPMTRFQTYRPLAQHTVGYLGIALRGKVSTEALRETVAELDPDLPLNDIGSARGTIDGSLARLGMVGWLLSSFGLLGLLLASLGIYGVIAGFVVQRTNEIGVRMALGAQLSDVLWLVVKKGLRLTLAGLAIGLVGALGIARLLGSIAPEMEFGDPLAIGMVSALLMLVAVLACWLPARRAARINPLSALRCD
jgi:putative ABC transport system permease protein